MALALPYYPLASGVISLSQVNSNFNAISQKFGSIVDADVQAGANISIDKLSAQYQEVMLTLELTSADFAPAAFGGASAGWPAVGATTPLKAVPIPGTNGDPAWTATDVSWACNDVGTGIGSFDIRLGSFNGAGIWVNTTSIVTGVTIASAVNNLGNQGKALENGSVSLAFSATSRAIAIMSAGVDAACLVNGVNANSWLAVSIVLRRKIKGAT